MSRKIPKPSIIKRLFSLSGNVCAFPACENTHIIEGIVVGKVAHICAAEMDGPRYDVAMTDEDRRAFENLIILCPTHHDLVDKLPEKYDVAFLQNAKLKHERVHESADYEIADSALDMVVDELNIVQSNTLHSGVQNNYQNIIAGENIQDFLERSLGDSSNVAKETESDSVSEEGEEGILEAIDEASITLPIWVQTIQESSDVIASVGPIMDMAVREMEKSDRKGSGIQGRIRILKKTSVSLMPIADRIYNLGEKFDRELVIINRGMGAIVNISSQQEGKVELETMEVSIRELSNSADVGLGSLDSLLENMKPLESITRDMKKPIARMKDGLSLIRKGKPTINSWLDIIESKLAS